MGVSGYKTQLACCFCVCLFVLALPRMALQRYSDDEAQWDWAKRHSTYMENFSTMLARFHEPHDGQCVGLVIDNFGGWQSRVLLPHSVMCQPILLGLRSSGQPSALWAHEPF